MPSDKELWMCCYPDYQEKRESTTFWMDFTIADKFGKKAIEDTFKRAFNEWKSNYKYLTELVGVLNHKIWQHYEIGDEEISRLYDKLWRRADSYGQNHLKGDALTFFFSVLD